MTARTARRVRAPGPRTAAVWLLIGALLAAAAGLNLAFVGNAPHPTAQLPWLLLVPAFALAETCVIHLTVKREAISFAFAEVPFVLGLFLVSPGHLITARVLGTALALAARRQAPLKVVFNLAQYWLGAAAAVSAWGLLAGTGGVTSGRAWGAATVAAVLVEVIATLAVTAVIALRGAGSLVPVGLGTGILAATANACFALVTLAVIRTSSTGLWTVAVLAGFLVLAQRAHHALLRRHDTMERLQTFTHRVGGGELQLDAVAVHVLLGVRDLLEVHTVTLSLAASPNGWVCDDTGVRRCAVGPARPEAMSVALHGEDGVVGTLTVAGSLANVGGVRPADRALLEALAGHAAVALHNGLLAEQLRGQVSENAHQAMHDALTGLPNRAMFEQATSAALALQPRSAILLLDLDRFKEINDSLGHAAGDDVLREVGARLRAALGDAVCVARLGGDEFAVVLAGAGHADARACAERVLTVLADPLDVIGVPLAMDASLGIALAPDHGGDVATLLRRADVAMYDAKAGHTGICVYDNHRDHNSAERLALVADLRAGINDNQLVLAYQPKAAMETGAVSSVEALVRWQHPARGLVPPDEFIGMAERTGLIAPLTDWVLRAALAQCRRWLDDGLDLSVAVNISPQTLHDPGFPAHLTELLGEAQVPAPRLTLEITEGALMADPERAIEVLWQLRRAGVRLSVDDLGVGHSSLMYLKRLPVHEVKIDRSFVSGMADDADDAAIVGAVVGLAHKLRMTVVAEGIEDERTWLLLSQLACDLAQGYWLSRPLPAEEVAAWVHGRERATDGVVIPISRLTRAVP